MIQNIQNMIKKTQDSSNVSSECTESGERIFTWPHLVRAAWGRRVGDLRFNPAVLLDVVEIQIVVQVCLQKKKKEIRIQNLFTGMSAICTAKSSPHL